MAHHSARAAHNHSTRARIIVYTSVLRNPKPLERCGDDIGHVPFERPMQCRRTRAHTQGTCTYICVHSTAEMTNKTRKSDDFEDVDGDRAHIVLGRIGAFSFSPDYRFFFSIPTTMTTVRVRAYVSRVTLNSNNVLGRVRVRGNRYCLAFLPISLTHNVGVCKKNFVR